VPKVSSLAATLMPPLPMTHVTMGYLLISAKSPNKPILIALHQICGHWCGTDHPAKVRPMMVSDSP
jgi:hypothetical protein